MPSIEEQTEAGVNKAIESPKFLERLKAAFSGELQSLQTKLSTAEASVVTKDEELKTLKEKLTAAEGQVTSKDAEIKDLKAKAEKAEKDATEAKEALKAKEGDVDRRANVKAGEKIAKAGHRPVAEQEKDNTLPETADVDEIRAEMATEKDPKKKMALARQCREARGQGEIFGKNSRN
jgi:predicted  nucleic acid-binding Zn-ribbon protein